MAPPQKVKALFDFVPTSEWELGMHEGDIIEVIGTFEDGWWSGKIFGKIGLFPKDYCEPIKAGVKMRIDESRACYSIKRMQMQLGLARDNAAKVEEIKQEADALTADFNNLKVNSSSRNLLTNVKMVAASRLEETEKKYKEEIHALQTKLAISEHERTKLRAKLDLVASPPSTPKHVPSLVLPSSLSLPPSPSSSFSRFSSPSSSFSSTSSFSSSVSTATTTGLSEETKEQIERKLSKTRVVSCVRLWKLQILKMQVESLLVSLDSEAHAKLDMEEGYKLKIQKLMSLLEKERRGNLTLAPPPPPSHKTKSPASWLSHKIKKDGKVKKDKEKEIVTIRKKCEEMEQGMAELKKTNESLININRVLMVQMRDVMSTMQRRASIDNSYESPRQLRSSSNPPYPPQSLLISPRMIPSHTLSNFNSSYPSLSSSLSSSPGHSYSLSSSPGLSYSPRPVPSIPLHRSAESVSTKPPTPRTESEKMLLRDETTATGEKKIVPPLPLHKSAEILSPVPHQFAVPRVPDHVRERELEKEKERERERVREREREAKIEETIVEEQEGKEEQSPKEQKVEQNEVPTKEEKEQQQKEEQKDEQKVEQKEQQKDEQKVEQKEQQNEEQREKQNEEQDIQSN